MEATDTHSILKRDIGISVESWGEVHMEGETEESDIVLQTSVL